MPSLDRRETARDLQSQRCDRLCQCRKQPLGANRNGTVDAPRLGIRRVQRRSHCLRPVCKFRTERREESMLSKTSVVGIVCLVVGLAAGCADEVTPDAHSETAIIGDDYTATHYPIVLMPG